MSKCYKIIYKHLKALAKDKVQARGTTQSLFSITYWVFNIISENEHSFTWSSVCPQVSYDCFISLIWGSIHASVQWPKLYPGTFCTHWSYVKQASFCRTYPSCHPSWHHGLKPRKNPNLLIPISQNLQRKVSGHGKATLLLHQPLSKLLGQPHSPITHPCSPLCVLWLPDEGERAGEPSLPAATHHPSRKTAPSAWTTCKIISCMESVAWYKQVSQSEEEAGCPEGKTGAKGSSEG